MRAWLWLAILAGCGGATEETTPETADTGTETTTDPGCRRAATDTGTTTSGGCG